MEKKHNNCIEKLLIHTTNKKKVEKIWKLICRLWFMCEKTVCARSWWETPNEKSMMAINHFNLSFELRILFFFVVVDINF